MGSVQVATAVAVDVDLPLDLRRREPDGERAQPEARGRPIWAWPSSAVVAPQSGGCGFCSGLGCTRRLGICQYLPENSYSSLVQHPTTCSIASCHIWRLSAGSMPKPSSSARVAERPVPEVDPAVREQVEHGHRLGRAHRMVVGLGHEADAVAQADALGPRRDGAVEHLGIGAVRVLLQEVVLHRPEGVPPEAVAGHRLLERVVVGDQLAVGRPRVGHGDLVEQGELHGVSVLSYRLGHVGSRDRR